MGIVISARLARTRDHAASITGTHVIGAIDATSTLKPGPFVTRRHDPTSDSRPLK